jgi:transcriptional regulator with XRE-family HTH domain
MAQETRRIEFLAERVALAAELARLRRAAGLSTYELAQRLRMSQSKVSKIENGRVAASMVDVAAWARATGAPAKIDHLARRVEQAQTEAVAWRRVLSEGLSARQRQVAALEQVARSIRVFDPLVVPTLLQTAEYARRVCLAHHVDGPRDVGPDVAMRLERQAILYDERRQFEFLLAEAVLRRRVEPRSAMLAQLDRIRSISTLPNVAIAIIPTESQAVWPSHGFVLFEGEEALVVVETLTARVSISHPAEVAAYQAALERLRQAAAHGTDATAILDRLLRELLEARRPIPT